MLSNLHDIRVVEDVFQRHPVNLDAVPQLIAAFEALQWPASMMKVTITLEATVFASVRLG